jgi:hypothetical protein
VARAQSYHAIYLVLNELDFFEASLRAVYPHITGATVVTSHDRDRFGRPVEPDRTLEAILSRDLDPDRKVNVLVATDGVEHVLRNRAMALASEGPAPPDWFWIVDADEIWADDDVRRLKAYVEGHGARAYQVTADNYFRSWNHRIEQLGAYVVLVRRGVRFGDLRQLRARFHQKAMHKLAHEGVVPERLALRVQGTRLVPREVAIFHHGSYVGDRDRIAEKLDRSGHRDELVQGWLERVWDAWTPEMRDLHPVEPAIFPSTSHVPTADLPAAVRSHPWPDGWLEPG